ncbi:MAG TPA: aminotransferase class V-fold PLP-dependent enzyme [Ignavibacteriaceae bacterium]|nr:aminotransferase class V-fold PLP-dependent enzyme [Ignavibacteriaceae bacterium]
MTVQEARKYFPYLNSGKIYLNHASISPLSSLVTERVKDFLRERSETDIENVPKTQFVTESVRNKLARLINTSPDRIAFVDNTSNGLNIVAQGLNWKTGDRIILNDVEFPSNVYPFLNLKTQGVEVDFVKSNNGIVTADDIIRKITPKTKLISISSVQFLSGYRADLKKIGEVCKSKNILFCVDAIQGLGATTLNFEECNISFLACGAQKWLMGMMGLAFIAVSEELQTKLAPKYVGWQSVENPWTLLNYDLELKKSAEAFQNGTISVVGVNALDASLELFEMFGIENVEESVLANSLYLTRHLDNIGIKTLLSGYDFQHISGIISFRSDSAKSIYNSLTEANIICSLREGFVRFSPHFYNTCEEIDLVIERVKLAI